MPDVRTGGPGPCPDCDGTGRQTVGPLSLVCPGCGGGGRVLTEDRPGRRDGDDYDPDRDGPPRPVGRDPARPPGVCPWCLGSGEVVNLGGTGPPTGSLLVAACPRCRH